MRSILGCAGCVLAACGGTAANGGAQTPATPPPTGDRSLAALGDPAFVAAIARHARIATPGDLRLYDGDPPVAPASRDLGGDHPVFAVVGERGERVRVVSDHDDARIAVWIDRASLAHAAIAPIALAGGTAAAPQAGAWLATGADVELGSDARVALHDRDVRIAGVAPRAAIGEVWIGPVPEPPHDGSDGSDSDLILEESPAMIAKGSIVRAAPAADAPALADAIDDLGARVIRDGAGSGGWAEVELAPAGARVRGFVEDARISRDSFGRGGSSSDSMYFLSDTSTADIPAGACLYDRAGGDVIGVNLVARTRYVFSEPRAPWQLVVVGTILWNEVTVAVKMTPQGAELCPLPAPRPAPLAVAPRELGEPDVASRLTTMARIAHLEHAQLGADDLAPNLAPDSRELLAHPIAPVMTARGDRVQLAIDSSADRAALAVWVDRDALATVATAPIRLVDDHGRASPGAPGDTGVWLEPGADLVVGRAAGDLREVVARDDLDVLRAFGFAPAQSIGTSWTEHAAAIPAATADRPKLPAGAQIREAPDAHARVIAEIADDLGAGATIVAERGAWSEIEIARGRVRVRGFVPRAQLIDAPAGRRFLDADYAFGVHDADPFNVPSGTCLYDSAGAIVGVTRAAATRYGARGHAGWAFIYVGAKLWSIARGAIRIADNGTVQTCPHD